MRSQAEHRKGMNGKVYVFATLALALVAAALGFVPGLLPYSALVLVLATGAVVAHGFDVGARRRASDRAEPAKEASFRTRATYHLVLTFVSVLILVLLLVELLTLPAAMGKLAVFGDFAVQSVALYPAIVGLLLALMSGVLELSNEAGESRRRPHPENLASTYAALGFTGVFALLTAATTFGLLTPIGLRPERSVFMVAGGVVPAFFFIRSAARLPTMGDINDWLEHEERLKTSGVLRALTYSFAGLSVAGTLLAIVATLVGLPRAAQLAGLALAIGSIIPATFSVGVSRYVALLDDNIAEDKKKRRVILNAVSITLATVAAALGLATVLAALAQLAGFGAFQSLLDIFVGFYPAILSVALWALVATVLVRTRVRTEVAYTEWLKSQTILAAGISLVLLFFGVFIGAGFAQGTGIEIENAVLALSGSVLALVLFVQARALLPSVFVLVKEAIKQSEEADVELQENIKRKMMFTYMAGLLFMLGLVGFFAAKSLGVVKVENNAATEAGYFVYILIGVALAILLVVRMIQGRNIDPAWRKKQRAQEDIGKKRITAEELTRYLVLGITGTLALVFVFCGILVRVGKFPGGIDPKYSTDFWVFALLLGLGPFGYFYNREQARIAAINAKFPEFLRDLSESQRAGMTLTSAVSTASKGDYGALTPEIRKMANQIEWGVSFPDALRRFSKRVRSPLIERATSLIIQAENAGGNVVDILGAAADDAREIQMILKERKGSMSIYVMIIYVAFFVFLGVIAVLNSQFIPEVSKAVAKADGVSIGGLAFKKFDEGVFKALFFHAAVIQGLGGGMVAGVMEGGKPVSGLKHAFVLICIAYVVFRFLIGA